MARRSEANIRKRIEENQLKMSQYEDTGYWLHNEPKDIERRKDLSARLEEENSVLAWVLKESDK